MEHLKKGIEKENYIDRCYCPGDEHQRMCKFHRSNILNVDMLIMSSQESSLSSEFTHDLPKDVKITSKENGKPVGDFAKKLMRPNLVALWGLPFSCDRVQRELYRVFQFWYVLYAAYDKIKKLWENFSLRGSPKVPGCQEIILKNKGEMRTVRGNGRYMYSRERITWHMIYNENISPLGKTQPVPKDLYQQLHLFKKQGHLRLEFDIEEYKIDGPQEEEKVPREQLVREAFQKAENALKELEQVGGVEAVNHFLLTRGIIIPAVSAKPKELISRETMSETLKVDVGTMSETLKVDIGTLSETLKVGRFIVPSDSTSEFYVAWMQKLTKLELAEFEREFEKLHNLHEGFQAGIATEIRKCDGGKVRVAAGTSCSGRIIPAYSMIGQALRVLKGKPRPEPVVHDGWTEDEEEEEEVTETETEEDLQLESESELSEISERMRAFLR